MLTFVKEWIKEHEEGHVHDEDDNESNDHGHDPFDRRRVPGLVLALTPGAEFFRLPLNIRSQVGEDDTIAVTLFPIHVTDVNRPLRLVQ